MAPFSLDGRVALVTGSSKGLGYAMAMALGRAGARVALNYFNDEAAAEKAFNAFRAEDMDGCLVRANAADPTDVTRMVKEVEDSLGPVDILVVNATPDQPQRPIEEYDWELFETMIDFFVKSPFLLTRAVLPHMKETGFGRIINIGSEVFQRGVGNFTAYVAAKGGQNGFTRSLSSELAPFGITVNMVSPGWIPVERHADDPQEMKDAYRSLIPANRWGVPDDIGGLTVFLASEESSFITGQNIAVNGGMTVA